MNEQNQQLTKECNGLSTIQQPMVIREGDDHDGPDDDLPVHYDGFFFNSMHA
jgi:hypothetical protein